MQRVPAEPVEHLHTSERIQRAALDLFFDRGYKSTTMREIAVACSLTPGALYNHFTSKDHLLDTIITRVHVELADELRTALDEAGDDPRDRLYAYVRTHCLFHTRFRKEARIANQEIPSLSDTDRERITQVRRKLRSDLKQILREGTLAGIFVVPDQTVVTSAILNIGISLADWFHPDGRLDAEEISHLHAELVLRMVGAHEDGGR